MKKIILLAGLSVAMMGCTSDFERFNEGTSGITDEELARIPVGGQELQDIGMWILPNQENGWQMDMELPGVFSGYNAACHFVDDFSAYTPRDSWNEYPYTDGYKHLYSGYNKIKGSTRADITNPAFAMATIVRAATTQRLTDMYGPLPYTEVNGVDIVVPYDSQEKIYVTILDELKAAAETLNALPENFNKYNDFDPLFGGNMKEWSLYAHSLMLRMAVRMAKQQPAKAKEYAEYAMQHGVILDNAHNALCHTIDNPLFKVMNAWSDSRVNADIVEYLKAWSDPRLPKYVSPNNQRQYVGYRGGSPINIKGKQQVPYYSGVNLTKTSPIVLFNAAETYFLMAEAALNGWNVGGQTPEQLYNKGVQTSFEQFNIGAEAAATYLQNSKKRGAFTDPYHPELNDEKFSSEITVNWADAEGDKEKQLSKIISQKWLAMFPYNTIEAWTEWRRTGYPNMLPSLNNRSAGLVEQIHQVNGKDQGGMRRLTFGITDWNNKDMGPNMEQAVEYLGGPDSYSTNLWWAK